MTTGGYEHRGASNGATGEIPDFDPDWSITTYSAYSVDNLRCETALGQSVELHRYSPHGLDEKDHPLAQVGRALSSPSAAFVLSRYDMLTVHLDGAVELLDPDETDAYPGPDLQHMLLTLTTLTQQVVSTRSSELNRQVKRLQQTVEDNQPNLWVRLDEDKRERYLAQPRIASRLASLLRFDIREAENGDPLPVAVLAGSAGQEGLWHRPTALYLPVDAIKGSQHDNAVD